MSEPLDDVSADDRGQTRHRRAGAEGRGWGCLAALVLVVGGFYLGADQGRLVRLRPVLLGPRRLSRARARAVLPGRARRDDRRDRTRLKAAGRRRLGRRVHRRRRRRPDATGIQVGYYELKKEMKAADALDVLVDPANMIRATVTVPEGLRVTEIVDLLADNTDYPKRAACERALRQPGRDRPARLRRAATPRATCSPSTYDFGPHGEADDDPHDDGRPLARRPPTRPSSRSRAPSSATRPAS